MSNILIIWKGTIYKGKWEGCRLHAKKNNADELVYVMILEEPNMIKAFVELIKNVETHSGML